MSRREVNCEGDNCKYYNKYYMVQKTADTHGAWAPCFDKTEERCLHPKVKDRLIQSLRECPKEKE